MATAKKPVVRKTLHTPTPKTPVSRDLEKFVRGELRIMTDAIIKMEKELEKFLTKEKVLPVRHAAPRTKRPARGRTLAVRH